jgi:hypothetical protein
VLGPTAFCSTILPVGIEFRLPSAARTLEFNGSKPALFGTEDLSGMIARKETIARLQQTVALSGRELRILQNFELMIRIRVGQAGVRPVSQVSL